MSYLLTFVGVVGYIYDCFLLGVVLVVVLVVVRGFDWLVGTPPSARAADRHRSARRHALRERSR